MIHICTIFNQSFPLLISKNQVRNRLKIQFVKLDFSNLIFQKSSTDQQGVRDIADFSLKLVAFFKIVGHGNVIKKDISCTLLT